MVRSLSGSPPPSVRVRPPTAVGRDDRLRPKAIGYIRFLGESDAAASSARFHDQLKSRCERHRIELVRVVEETNNEPEVTPIPRRTGLLEAIDAIGHGEASVLLADAFHLGGRDSNVLLEIVSRMEVAGGRLLADGRFIC